MAKRGSDDTFGSLIEVIGKDAAFKLVESFGGTRISIPKYCRPGGAIENAIGEHAAAVLSNEHGGCSIRIPLMRWWRIRVYRERGMSLTGIARRLGVTDNTVSETLKNMGLTAGRTLKKRAKT